MLPEIFWSSEKEAECSTGAHPIRRGSADSLCLRHRAGEECEPIVVDAGLPRAGAVLVSLFASELAKAPFPYAMDNEASFPPQQSQRLMTLSFGAPRLRGLSRGRNRRARDSSSTAGLFPASTWRSRLRWDAVGYCRCGCLCCRLGPVDVRCRRVPLGYLGSACTMSRPHQFGRASV